MTTTTPWSDTPPSPDKPGDYHLRYRPNGLECIGTLCGHFWKIDRINFFDGVGDRYQFGPAVLSAEDTVNLTAEVERLRQCQQEHVAILLEWHGIWQLLGGPGASGSSKVAETRAEVERLRAENAELRERLTVDDLGELERYRSVPFADAGKIKVRVSGATPLEPMSYPVDDGVFHGA